MPHLVVRADVEDTDMLGKGLPLTQGRGTGAARLADQKRLQQEDRDQNITLDWKKSNKKSIIFVLGFLQGKIKVISMPSV